MPKRPPKYWADRVKASLGASGVTATPGRLMGWIWRYGMKPETRRAILRREYDFAPANTEPAALPKPIDLRGYDHTLVRVVPEVDRLIEMQVKLPKHVWNDMAKLVKDWPDVEIDVENKRIVRRGKLNKATNLFIDGE